MIKNITKQFQKLPEQEVYDHYAWLDRLLNYTDMLPIETPIDLILVADRKDYFFETFPVKWRKEYVDTKNEFLLINSRRYHTYINYYLLCWLP